MRAAVILAFAACAPPAAPTAPPPVLAPVVALPGLTILEQLPADALALSVVVRASSCTVVDEHGISDTELHVPIGRAVRLMLATTETPEGALEVAVGSGHAHVAAREYHYLGFRIDRPGRPGEFEWECPAPSSKRAIIAQPPEAYAAYLAKLAPPPVTREDQVALGRHLYDTKGCVMCHTLDGSIRIGPSWKGIWGKPAQLSDGTERIVDAAYVRASIATPSAFARPNFPNIMPSYEGQLQPEELAALVAFVESLAD